MNHFFKMDTDHATEWFLSMEKITAFGMDAGGRFWLRCDGQEYGTHRDSMDQFLAFQRKFKEFHEPQLSFNGINPANLGSQVGR